MAGPTHRQDRKSTFDDKELQYKWIATLKQLRLVPNEVDMKLIFNICLLAVCFFGAQALTSIEVSNGALEGEWGKYELCPEDTVASAFSLNVEHRNLAGDDTAVNGIRLFCTNSTTGEEYNITSAYDTFGEWGNTYSCNGDAFLRNFALRVVPAGTDVGDKTGVNNVRFFCSTGLLPLTGNGLAIGEWGEYSENCLTGICGIQTRVLPNKGALIDDSALNDVTFLCC